MALAAHDVSDALEIEPGFFDDVPMLTSDGAPIVRAHALDARMLSALAARKICAIHIPGYFPEAHARKASRFVRRSVALTRWDLPAGGNEYVKTETKYGIGSPQPTGPRQKTKLKEYYRKALPAIRQLRAAFAPYTSPMDLLRLELDELWGPGAALTSYGGQKAFAGLVRMITPDDLLSGIRRKQGVCHTDHVAQDSTITLSANLYLGVPRRGGELKMWNVDLRSQVNFENPVRVLFDQYAFRDGVQEIIQQKLPRPHTIRPRPGDLVLLDTSRPHAVAGFSSGYRMSIQTFVRARDAKDRLKLVS